VDDGNEEKQKDRWIDEIGKALFKRILNANFQLHYSPKIKGEDAKYKDMEQGGR